MKKFIVYTRAIPGIRKGNDPPSVIEVEGELIKPTEDPSVMWLPPGEFKFRILKPEYLYEPKEIVKEKLGFSPDEADAFVLTFAEPVTPKQTNARARQSTQATSCCFLCVHAGSRDSS